MKNDVPRLAPPFPPEIDAARRMDPSTATDEDLAEAVHLLANYVSPLVGQITMIREEATRRLHDRSRTATEQAA